MQAAKKGANTRFSRPHTYFIRKSGASTTPAQGTATGIRGGSTGMIPKKHRGISGKRAAQIRKKGIARRFRWGRTFRLRRDDPGSTTRVLVVVSGRGIFKATARNRIRRRLQAALLPLVRHWKPAEDLVIVWQGDEKGIQLNEFDRDMRIFRSSPPARSMPQQ